MVGLSNHCERKCVCAEHLLDVHTSLVNAAELLISDLHYLHF